MHMAAQRTAFCVRPCPLAACPLSPAHLPHLVGPGHMQQSQLLQLVRCEGATYNSGGALDADDLGRERT